MKRLEPLGIQRGFDMRFARLPDFAPCIAITFLAMVGLGDTAFAAQFDRVADAGLHFYDCIFPLFLFISGVTWPYSLASQRAKGLPGASIARKILKRAALLFLLALDALDSRWRFAVRPCDRFGSRGPCRLARGGRRGVVRLLRP